MARKSLPPVGPSAPQTVDELAAAIVKVEDRLRDGDYTDAASELELIKQRDRLREQLETIKVNAGGVPEIAGVPVAEKRDIEIASILFTSNHRRKMHDAETARMALGFKAGVPLMQAIGVRMHKDGKSCDMIWGSRRTAAAMIAQWKTIPAHAYPHFLTDEQAELLRTVENFHRAELNPTERALAIAFNVEKYSAATDPGTLDKIKTAGGVAEYVAAIFGRPADWVRDHLYINKLKPTARDLLAAGRIDLGHARELAKVADEVLQSDLAEQFARNLDGIGGTSVDSAKRIVSDSLCSLRGVPWRLDVIVEGKDPALVPAGCSYCQFNSRTEPSLFEHDPEAMAQFDDVKYAGTCRNPACFEARKEICEQQLEKITAKVETAAKKADGTVPKELVANIAGDTPLRLETVQRKAKANLDTSKPKKSGGRNDEPKVDPVVKERERYQNTREAWGRTTAKKIISSVKSDPLASLALDLLISISNKIQINAPHYSTYGIPSANESRYQSDQAKVLKAVSSPGIKKLLNVVSDATIASFEMLAKETGPVDEWQASRLSPEALIHIAASLGVKLEPPPDRDAMTTAASKPAEPKGDAKKPAKPAKKKKRQPALA